MPKLRFVALALGVLPGFVGCASVLGIEAATYDSKLDKGGASNAGGSGNAGESGAGGATDSGKSLCDEYCDSVMANCVGAAEQYVSKAVCMKICARLDPGQPGDDAGNTVNCRYHYAELVPLIGEPATNCSAAGPGGANSEKSVCGSYCEGLCRIAFDTCKGAQRVYASISECVSDCETLPDLGDYADSVQEGNSVQCRLYHVSAAQIDPVIHCPHVSGLVGPCKVP